ncbi:hypothetical protein ACOSQ3_016760 [Xanthoceras sorbifolium]
MGAKSENTHKQYSSGQKSRENVNANMLIRVQILLMRISALEEIDINSITKCQVEEGVKVSEVISKNRENNTLATVLDDEVGCVPVSIDVPVAGLCQDINEEVRVFAGPKQKMWKRLAREKAVGGGSSVKMEVLGQHEADYKLVELGLRKKGKATEDSSVQFVIDLQLFRVSILALFV